PRCIQTLGFRYNHLASRIPANGIQWPATLRRVDAGDLPAARDGVEYSIIYGESFSFSDWKFVLHRPYEAMGRIERRWPILAAEAMRVLRKLIAAGAADGAAVIHRPGPGIADQRGQARRKTLVQLDSHTVVVS